MPEIYLTSFSVMDLEILDTVSPKLSSRQNCGYYIARADK